LKMLKVYEIFPSIQGEGLHIGTPAVFIRLVGCNLNCIWCDTKYARTGGKEMTEEGILECLEELDEGLRFVVITGGEPLIQDIEKLVYMLASHAYTVHIETNGTINMSNHLFVDHFIVSPKLMSAKISRDIAIVPGVLRRYKESKKAEFKFVIADYKDFEEMYRLVDEYKLLPVVLQPVHNDPVLAREIINWVAKHRAYAARILPQLHKTWKLK